MMDAPVNCEPEYMPGEAYDIRSCAICGEPVNVLHAASHIKRPNNEVVHRKCAPECEPVKGW